MTTLVRDVMTPDPTCCTPEDSVIDCARLMEQLDVGMIPVVESRDTRKLVGVVTDRDLCLEVIARGLDPGDTVVEECMTDELFTLRACDDVDRALAIMRQEKVRRLPVIDDDGACIGVLAQADLCERVGPEDLAATLEEISRPTR